MGGGGGGGKEDGLTAKVGVLRSEGAQLWE